MTYAEKRRKDAERQRLQYERDKARGIVKVSVKVPADKRQDLVEYARRLRDETTTL